ncbi:MAG: hypothetical protein ACE145_14540 [Terriglobia bacterium]
MSVSIDGLALEARLSGLITNQNVERLAGILGGMNPGAGIIAGMIGAVIVRAADNINAFIAEQWGRPIMPPEVLIPMSYDVAVRFLRTRGLAETFAPELSAAESEPDLWTKRKKQDDVCSIASVMDLVLNHRDRESAAFGFFASQISQKNYRQIWDHWEEYLQAREELKTLLPMAQVRGVLSVAFGDNPLKTFVPDVLRAEAAKGLRETISKYIHQKLGLEVDLDALLARVA